MISSNSSRVEWSNLGYYVIGLNHRLSDKNQLIKELETEVEKLERLGKEDGNPLGRRQRPPKTLSAYGDASESSGNGNSKEPAVQGGSTRAIKEHKASLTATDGGGFKQADDSSGRDHTQSALRQREVEFEAVHKLQAHRIKELEETIARDKGEESAILFLGQSGAKSKD